MSVRVQFGDCAFDSETRELARRGRPVHLSPKAFHLLEVLLEGRPRAFSKDELHQRIWPDAFVSEATLASLVAEIREAIGDGGKEARYIRTIHGFGYAFAATASEASPRSPAQGESSWRLVWEDRVIPLPEGETIFGRDHLAGIRIASESVSRRHARIVVASDTVTLEDCGSKNGTYLRDRRIEGIETVHDGDSIRIGRATLVARFLSDRLSTKTEMEGAPLEETPSPPPHSRTGKRKTP